MGGVFLTLGLLFLMGSCGKTGSPETTPILPPTTTANAGGTMTPSQTVPHGQTITVTLTLQPHYQLQQWQSDCGSFDPQQNTLELLVQKDCTITARLTLDTPLYLDTNGLTIRSRPQGERFIGQTKLLAHPDHPEPLAIRIVDQTARRTLIQQQD